MSFQAKANQPDPTDTISIDQEGTLHIKHDEATGKTN
jgi:hypothetical protein